MIVGIFLIVIGALWVLSNAGVISSGMAQYFWPVAIIAIGLQLLWDYFKKDKCCSKTEEKGK